MIGLDLADWIIAAPLRNFPNISRGRPSGGSVEAFDGDEALLSYSNPEMIGDL